MPAIPKILEITDADHLQDIVYIVQPNHRVSQDMLEIYSMNNPRSCTWLDRNTLAMSWAAFNLFVLGPTEGMLKPIAGRVEIPKDTKKIPDLKDNIMGVDAIKRTAKANSERE